MVFNQSPRVARPVDVTRPGPAYDLARTLADWARQRDQAAPVRPREGLAEVSIANDQGVPAGLFFLTAGDIDELRQALGVAAKEA